MPKVATELKPPHETVSNIGPAAKAIQPDVTQEDDWRAALLESFELGVVDIVRGQCELFSESLDRRATWRQTFVTNLDAHFLNAK